ncbi:hypothetical protein IWX90DRAFT_415608 [Phyllosticta citrichinensis]|uniref:Rho-GAP domain-containing protein n=1 Tax=Phyllosticta citrichinensis TaxID=1130410 RepID=A0ABR1XQ09_9PEZI
MPSTAQASVPGRNWDPPPESQSGDVPSKRDLASWWRQFKRGSAKKDEEKGIFFRVWTMARSSLGALPSLPSRCLTLVHRQAKRLSGVLRRCSHFASRIMFSRPELILSKTDQEKPKGIFGVPLQESIKYANVAISLFNEQGESYIYGYVPIVVAKCGVFLKEKAVDVEGIFRLSGSEKRIKELREAFNSPDRYGKGLDWAGYTVHDAANILRRYFNQLPEPIIPLEFYERFREPLRDHQAQAVGPMDGQRETVGDFDMDRAIREYQRLITELPPLNRQLLLYILDLLAVFASKSDLNKMTTANLAAIFQPGILSHPNHDMSPPDYRLSQDVLIFLIENQDNFLIGMQGTAADQKTVDEVESGPPSPSSKTPVTPNRSKTHSLGRSTSNASAGAESVRQQGIMRRNVSVSSRKSKASGSVTAASPASGASTGLHRSNTVPSKRSPAIIPQRFSREYSESHNSPRSPAGASLSIPESNRPSRPPPSPTHIISPPSSNDTTPLAAPPSVTSATGLLPSRETPQKGRVDNSDREMPGGFRSFTNMFSASPGSDTEQKEKRRPNKLQKKRAPSTNPSAASSTHSLHGTLPGGAPPSPLPPNVAAGTPIKEQTQPSAMPESSPPKQQQPTSANPLQPSMSPSASTRSHSTAADYSEVEHGDEASTYDHTEKDRKRHWRISHKKEPSKGVTEHGFGSNPGAEQSMSSFGSRGGRKSLTIEPHEASIWSDASREAEKKAGPIEWFRGKLAERKEREEAKQRAKSPPNNRMVDSHGHTSYAGSAAGLGQQRSSSSLAAHSQHRRGRSAELPRTSTILPEAHVVSPVPEALETKPTPGVSPNRLMDSEVDLTPTQTPPSHGTPPADPDDHFYTPLPGTSREPSGSRPTSGHHHSASRSISAAAPTSAPAEKSSIVEFPPFEPSIEDATPVNNGTVETAIPTDSLQQLPTDAEVRPTRSGSPTSTASPRTQRIRSMLDV